MQPTQKAARLISDVRRGGFAGRNEKEKKMKKKLLAGLATGDAALKQIVTKIQYRRYNIKNELRNILITIALLICFVSGAHAVPITITDSNSVTRFISPDGATVTELKPVTSLSSSSFNTSSFNSSYGGQFSGYTVNTGSSSGDQTCR